jgi:hypothetical protein
MIPASYIEMEFDTDKMPPDEPPQDLEVPKDVLRSFIYSNMLNSCENYLFDNSQVINIAASYSTDIIYGSTDIANYFNNMNGFNSNIQKDAKCLFRYTNNVPGKNYLNKVNTLEFGNNSIPIYGVLWKDNTKDILSSNMITQPFFEHTQKQDYPGEFIQYYNKLINAFEDDQIQHLCKLIYIKYEKVWDLSKWSDITTAIMNYNFVHYFITNNFNNFEDTTKNTNNASLGEKIENIAEHLYDFYSIVYSQVQMMKMVNYI